jgi:hypothetical protein
VLALHLLEIVDGLGPQVAVHAVGAGVVEQLHRALFIGELGGLLRAGATGEGKTTEDRD